MALLAQVKSIFIWDYGRGWILKFHVRVFIMGTVASLVCTSVMLYTARKSYLTEVACMFSFKYQTDPSSTLYSFSP